MLGGLRHFLWDFGLGLDRERAAVALARHPDRLGGAHRDIWALALILR